MELKELFDKVNANLEKPLSPIDMDRLSDFVRLDGMAVEVLYEAFAAAVEQEADKPKTYMWSVLRVWRREGVKTLNDVEANRERFEVKKQGQAINWKSPRTTRVPADQVLPLPPGTKRF